MLCHQSSRFGANFPQIWKNQSPRQSSPSEEGKPGVPIKISPQNSYMEQTWVVISPDSQSFDFHGGSRDTYPALKKTNPLEAGLLPYCLTDYSQNELQGGRSGSLPSLSTRHELSLEYLFRRLAGDDQRSRFHYFELLRSWCPHSCCSDPCMELNTLLAEVSLWSNKFYPPSYRPWELS